ncbi:hypothetical protein, partial [Nocardia cyriacigeorgica]|uniref:hypothetical protein n=1 Tax=Nocardia cyriacigeorgica TaxID=135487 RepID=UPI002457F419
MHPLRLCGRPEEEFELAAAPVLGRPAPHKDVHQLRERAAGTPVTYRRDVVPSVVSPHAFEWGLGAP